MHLLFVMSFFIQVVASQDWPDVTNYAALAGVQANGQEWIHDLFGVSPFSGTVARAGGRIMYDTYLLTAFLYDLVVGPWFLNNFY